MLDAIGETLPLALAIAFSPLAIIGVVVMLLSERPRTASLGFLGGWLTGLGFVAAAGYLLASLVPSTSGDVVAPVVLFLIGVACIALAVRQWRNRPGADDEVALPGWMARLDGLTGLKSFVFGAIVGGVKPKNLLLAFGAGVSVEAAGVVGGEAVIVLIVFIVFASLSIIVPVAGSLIGGERLRAPLGRLREWMVRHNSAMVGVILLFVGVVLIGAALSGISR